MLLCFTVTLEHAKLFFFLLFNAILVHLQDKLCGVILVCSNLQRPTEGKLDLIEVTMYNDSQEDRLCLLSNF